MIALNLLTNRVAIATGTWVPQRPLSWLAASPSSVHLSPLVSHHLVPCVSSGPPMFSPESLGSCSVSSLGRYPGEGRVQSKAGHGL